MQNEFMWGFDCKSVEKALWKKYGSRVGHIDMMTKESDNVWIASNEMGDEFRIVLGKGADGSVVYFY